MSDYFVFGDVDSRDYSGIHVFNKSVDNTPKRVYEVKNIAGRNGAFYVDQGRYEDVEHSYGVVALTKSAGSNFINALVSQVGYHRLSDSFNEDEFYLATLTDAVEAKVSKSTRDVNTFDITFTRKPQRFLKSGEIPRTIGGSVTNTQTESGSIVSIESDGGDAVTSLIAQIEPVQSGSGDPSPTNVRPITGWTAVNVIVSPTTIASDGTTTTTALGRTVYGGTVDVVTGVLTVTHQMDTYTGDSVTSVSSASGVQFARIVASNASPGRQVKCDRYTPSLVAASGHITWVSATQQVVRIFDSRFTDAATAKSILNENPVHYCYPLTTPQTYALTAQQVELLTGQNHVWADTGDITITWGDDPNKLVNPTLYDSHPLLHVWGYGDIGIGGGTLSINNDEYGRTLLANRLSKSATSVSSYLDESAVLMLNSGDDVFVSAGSSVVFPLTFLGSASINITSATIANSSPYDIPMESSVSNFGNYVTVSVSLPQLDFIFNQTSQYLSSNIRVTINYTEAGVSKTSTAECQIYAEYSLTPLGRYRVALFYFDVAVDKFYNPSTAVMTIQPIYGVSTQRPFSDDADFYFDLDIGEAYKIEDGQIISVNNAVTIPAQLPTLKSGANTITYDDTITQFKVVPRWWEV